MERQPFHAGEPGQLEATVSKGEKGPESITNGMSNQFAHGGGPGGPGSTKAGTHRGIKSRQAQMLAIGGTIGACYDFHQRSHESHDQICTYSLTYDTHPLTVSCLDRDWVVRQYRGSSRQNRTGISVCRLCGRLHAGVLHPHGHDGDKCVHAPAGSIDGVLWKPNSVAESGIRHGLVSDLVPLSSWTNLSVGLTSHPGCTGIPGASGLHTKLQQQLL